jgi:DNA-binding winged helix-turn-helix (wHTH) protein
MLFSLNAAIGPQRPMIFMINECSIDTDAYEVRRNGNLVPVEPQVFDLLIQPLENSDRVVTKGEISERVWHGRIVSEAALSSRIKAVDGLRKAGVPEKSPSPEKL